MKRVGILTFHYINNYGALLQAYALKKYIDGVDGFSAEIINYIPENFVYYPYELGKQGQMKMQAKVHKLQEFLEEHCEVGMHVISDLSSCKFDIICVGSDQVWNYKINNSDTNYLLESISAKVRKISYASSIGLPVELISSFAEVFRKNLSRFYRVSVREEEHANWLKKECEIDCQTVLDPTFLLDEKDYEKILVKGKLKNSKYVLFIWYPHDDQLIKAVEFTNTISRKYELPIVHNLLNQRPYILANDGGYMFYEGVGEFLWYIKNAEMVVTNSYHTMLMAIHFKKPFYVFLVESMRSRFDSIAYDFAIGNRYVTEYIDPSCLSDEMDYESIYKSIEPYRIKSKEYIREALI